MLQKSRQYNSKCVGIDATKSDETGKFEVTLIIKDIPIEQLHIWKENLFKDVIIDVDASQYTETRNSAQANKESK